MRVAIDYDEDDDSYLITLSDGQGRAQTQELVISRDNVPMLVAALKALEYHDAPGGLNVALQTHEDASEGGLLDFLPRYPTD